MKFRIRVDDLNNKDLFVGWIDKYSRYVVVHHQVNDNPHFHMLLDDPKCDSVHNMRMRVKRWFKIEKSTDYSVKICDEERDLEYLQYLFNEKHGNKATLLYSAGYTDDVITDCKEKAKVIANDFKRVAKKKHQITIFDMAEEVKELLNDVKIRDSDPMEFWKYASRCAIIVAKKYRKGMDYNMIIKIVNTYTGIVDEDLLASKVAEYFSRRYE